MSLYIPCKFFFVDDFDVAERILDVSGWKFHKGKYALYLDLSVPTFF